MDRTNASVTSSQRASVAKARVNLSMTWDHPSLPEPDNYWDTQDGAASLNYDASASASFQPSPAPTSLSLTAPIISAIKFAPSYLQVDLDDGTGQGSSTYMLSDIAPTLNTLTITTTASEGEESGCSTGGAASKHYTSSSSITSHAAAAMAAVGSSGALGVPCPSPLSASSSSSLSLPSPPMSPTSSDYTRALRELEELAREEDWMTSASEYESDAEVRRGRERSSSGEKERSLLAPRNYIASSLFNGRPTSPAAPPTAVSVSAVLSASSALSSTPAPSVVAASSSQPSASLPPLPPHKASAVAFTIQKKPLASASSPHSAPSPTTSSASSPAVTPSSTMSTLTAHVSVASAAITASGSSPSHTRSISRQLRRRTAEAGAVLSRPSSRPDSRAGSRANSPPRGSSPHTLATSLSAASAGGEGEADNPLPSVRQLKRGSSSRRRTWNHSPANSQDDSTLTFDLSSTSRRSSLHRNDSAASPSASAAPSAATSPRASVVSASRQMAQAESESLKQRRARRQLSQMWMNSPASTDAAEDDVPAAAGCDSAPVVLTRRRSRSHSRSRSASRLLLTDPGTIASTSSASSSSSAVEPTHRRQLSTPPASSSCPVLPPCASFHGEDTRASSLPSPLSPTSTFPLPSPPPLTSTSAVQTHGDKVALVLEGRQIAVLSLAAVQQLLDGHRAKDDGAERDGRGSRGGRRRSGKLSDEAEEISISSRRAELSSDESEDEEDRAARVRLQSQRRRSQKRLSVRTSKADPTVLAALHRREQSIGD